MKVCILGTGRSGTTILYSLMQKIFKSNFPHDSISTIYEPFLWGAPVWNKNYETLLEEWSELDSLSIEGMYCNQKLPLFLLNPKHFDNIEYFKEIFKTGTDTPVIVKFLRANGRFNLIKHYCPEGKFIYIIRNPLSVLNSLITRFSLFGDDYHKSDYNRFISEINSSYNLKIRAEDIKSMAEKELLYWYYMNKYLLQSFRNNKEEAFLISHEDFVANKKENIKNMCEFLGLEFKDHFYKHSLKDVGPITSKVYPTKEDLMITENYLVKYKEILEEYNIKRNDKKLSEIIKNIKNNLSLVNYSNIYLGKTANFIRDNLNRKDEIIKDFNNTLKKKDEIIKKKEKNLDEKDKTIEEIINKKDKTIKEIINKKDKTIEEIINKKDKKIEEIIITNDKIIQSLTTEKEKAISKLETIYKSKPYKVYNFVSSIFSYRHQKKYETLLKPYQKKAIDTLLASFSLKGKKILELCGDPDLNIAKGLVNLGAKKVICINKNKVKKEPINNDKIEYMNMDALELSNHFKEKYFDIVFGVAVLEHLNHLEEVLNELYKILTSKGIVYLHGAPIWPCHLGHHLWVHYGNKKYEFNGYNPIPDWHHLIFTKKEMKIFLESQNIPSEHVNKIVYFIYENSEINRYRYEDFIRIFEKSEFSIESYKEEIWRNPPKDIHELLVKAGNSPNGNYSCGALEVILMKEND